MERNLLMSLLTMQNLEPHEVTISTHRIRQLATREQVARGAK